MKAMGPLPPEWQADLRFAAHTPEDLAAQSGGTPLFVYDRAVIRARIAQFRSAFPGIALHYAIKANPFGPLLAFMSSEVDGFDLASAGELQKLQAAGAGDRPVSFAGPGKTGADMSAGLAAAVTFNLESEEEWTSLRRIAARDSVRPRVAVRVNPPFGLKGSGMKMGGLASPFGVDHDRVPALVRRIIDEGGDWRGLHVYAGSQSLSADAIIDGQRATVALAAEIAAEVGVTPPEVNLGGGFGIPYFAGDQPLDIVAVGAALKQTLDQRPAILRDTNFVIELGRWLVGEAGVYLTRVVDRKVSRGRTFLVTDGGLQHMLAASGNFGQLLRRNYPVAVANRFGAEAEEEVTVVGCLCTPLDLLADEITLPRAEVGDLIAIFCAGAYGLTASPQGFLSMPAAREVLV
ncbi:pyridoxal-dependent decarboxylase, exosortase A system-associated [Sphingomonas sp. KRR8]|uniref:pyridoxal-dependent decarboxylase, exosortase A system-associated n=1 Tax=Sphingomonas sp. KRR8 TaxID=2942996 RepID=UPI002021DF09|nr:pyridoxal-dependent decarboxylase, exosortase A system-associated [Sphingomonas sp. KRR8]URD62014.1 pyridoxal-dependent decarboxylase, exosortase A system-associated [Sphingomonas sp. KRR8]